MKRFITIVTGCIFLWYAGILLYPLLPGAVKTSYSNTIFKKARISSGLAILFDQRATLTGVTVSYRLYQKGSWEPEQQLLEPLFNDYITSGNLSSLKHCRLDAHLIQNVYNVRKYGGAKKMITSRAYARFSDHLFYSHNNNVRPDSLEVHYYEKQNDPNRLQLMLTFKSKP